VDAAAVAGGAVIASDGLCIVAGSAAATFIATEGASGINALQNSFEQSNKTGNNRR
jgi:hypothetical protein